MNISRLIALGMLLPFAISTAACTRAISNMQTLISDDCGRTWRVIPPGNTVPSRVGMCALMVTIPNYPMQGDANFKVNFKNRVLVTVSASYEYSITDALKFINNARYIGRQNSAGDSEANSAGQYETAENMLIDRRIREVASALLRSEDIVDFDQGAFEDRLLAEVNKAIAERGVVLNSMAFVPTPDEQTRQAIDAGAAIRVYDALKISDLGREMMVARAGAPRIAVTNVPATKEVSSEE